MAYCLSLSKFPYGILFNIIMLVSFPIFTTSSTDLRGSTVPLRSSHGPLRNQWDSRAPRFYAAPLRLRGGALSFLAAYILLKIGGNENPTKEDVKKLLNTVGAHIDEELIEKVVKELNGKDINELIERGKAKMMEDAKLFDAYDKLRDGGGPAAAASGGGAAAKEEEKSKGGGDKGDGDKGGGDKKGGGKEEKKKEEKKVEKKESEGSEMDDMGFGLFD